MTRQRSRGEKGQRGTEISSSPLLLFSSAPLLEMFHPFHLGLTHRVDSTMQRRVRLRLRLRLGLRLRVYATQIPEERTLAGARHPRPARPQRIARRLPVVRRAPNRLAVRTAQVELGKPLLLLARPVERRPQMVSAQGREGSAPVERRLRQPAASHRHLHRGGQGQADGRVAAQQDSRGRHGEQRRRVQHADDPAHALAQIHADEGSPLRGRAVRQLDARTRHGGGRSLLATRDADGL